ncbi:DUF5819 family protein [Frigoribacterium sp. PhB24]|uniref:DUF5819 family protein n=1 Tax=Frigoribacterium sp. PhB24 TaxID=2485204 RepID=UPI001F1B29BE|nr:DUF5819 family protein [Frigoribacterium sp. PhB24]
MAVVLCLLTAWHVFASFLWISPPTAMRQVVPGNALESYMIPWFGQSWSVFAPEPINGDYRFEVRALVSSTDGKDAAVTKWVSATDVEQSMAQHHLFPPRAAGLGVHAASALKGAWDGLSAEQQDTARLNYFDGDAWLGRMRTAMLQQQADSTAEVNEYIVRERYADAYATQIAEATWGPDVIRVQYRASRQNVIPYEDRNDADAERPAPQIAATGWRGLITLPRQDQDEFAQTFNRVHHALESRSR